jgi:hypothetical protein
MKQLIEALDLALEALEKSLPRLAPYGEQDWLDSKAAITAIKQVLAKDALYKLAEESCTSGLRLDDWDKIGCVNHDCDKCKAVQEPVAWGNLANWCLDSDRVLITDKTEAEKYHRDVYDLTPLYTAPPAAQPTAEDSSVVAAPVQEPVAFEDWHSANYVQTLEKYGDSYKNMHVRNRWQGWLGAKSTPPAAQRQWVGLNWEDMPDIRAGDHAFLSGARWAEAKLKEKNNG